MKSYVVYLLLNAGIVLGLWYFFPRTEVVQVFEQEEIDENVWVRRASVSDYRTLLNELRQDNQKLANALSSSNSEIASLTRLVGQLNTQNDALVDSLSNIQTTITVVDGQIADTSFTINRYFGNNLFRVQNTTTFENNLFSVDLSLHQQRDINIDVATTINYNKGLVMVFVSSEDFVELNYTAQTTLTPRRWKWYHYATAGFIVGGTLILIVN